MGREAEGEADQRQQLQLLLRRSRRLFAADERSFRMDRRSPAAAALRSAVTTVLPRFLGSYSDDTLAEYIVVLICNGKHQYQARDDLEAFLGDDSEIFVAWLWGYLSKQAVAPVDNCNVEHGVDNESENLHGKKNLLVAEVHREGAHIVKPKVSVPQAYHDLHKLDSAKGQNVTQHCISSTVTVSPERLGDDQCISEDQYHKKGQNTAGRRSFSITQFGAAESTAQRLSQEELPHGGHLGRNASIRYLPEVVGSGDERLPIPLKRRRNVWDRLGKPVVEDCGLFRGSHDVPVENGVHKKANLMMFEHDQRYRVGSNVECDILDRAYFRKFTNSYTDVNTVQVHEHTGKANRSRLTGRLSFGGGNVFHGDVERNNLQDREVLTQKSSLSLPVKSIQSQSLSELTSEMKGSPATVSEPTCNIIRPPKGHALTSYKSPPLTTQRKSESGVLHGEQVSSTGQSNAPSSVQEDDASCRNKPVKEEILDVKLKLKQIELDVLKLRSKQAQINNGKLGALSSGHHDNLEEDADSRTILVINVHFAATKEALSAHFMKCGTVLKVNILTDAATGHPKGAAYITFADMESFDKAVSLNGTSFLTRVLTVMRKAEAPPGFVASVEHAGRPLQPWNSSPFKKVSTPKQISSPHLQWKRDQYKLDKSPASCATN